MNNILVLSPHTDDAELGCGGLLEKQECKKTIVAFGRPANLENQITEEYYQSMAVLGCDYYIEDFPIRNLCDYRQEVLDTILRWRDKINPDLVLIPASTDTHQDHQVIHNEALRAFKGVTMLGYELPWNHYEFENGAFVELEEKHLDKKWKALQCYQSQIDLERPYFDREYIYGLGRVRGVQCRAPYAEAFEVLRVVL